MALNYTSNNLLSGKGLNITPISSTDCLNSNNDYSFYTGRSSFNPAINSLNLSSDYYNTSEGYNPSSGYGLVNAAAAVAKAAGQNTFADVPVLGGTNWGADLVKAPQAWAKGYTGKDVVVAVLDTGVDYNHEDLKNNIWSNPNEIAGNGKDDDGDGYIDDIHGWNFVDNNNNTLDNSNTGHGTHVSGTIAGENNNVGVTGIAYDAKIMPVKVLDDQSSGSITSIDKGIHYAVDRGANVINLSLGGPYPNNTLESAIEYASSKNVTVVMAACNDSNSAPGYPARYAKNNGIAVGAVDQNRNMAKFSNRAGSDPLAYVTAPGVNVYSSIPGNKYASLSGTSMAAPHVTGVVALMLSANKSLTNTQIRDIITQTAGNNTHTTQNAGTMTSNFANQTLNTAPAYFTNSSSTLTDSISSFDRNSINPLSYRSSFNNTDDRTDRPDLVVQNASAPSEVSSDGTIRVTYREKNQGNARAGSHNVNFYLSQDDKLSDDDILLGKSSVSSLAAGSSTEQSKSLNLNNNKITGRNYYLLFKADGDNNVTESNENNNIVAKRITINADTDLAIENASTPNVATAGSLIRFTYQINNLGSSDADDSTTKFYLSKDRNISNDDVALGSDQVGSLRAGSSRSESSSFTIGNNIAPGNYYVLYQADGNDDVNESNEDNNIFAKPITIINGRSVV